LDAPVQIGEELSRVLWTVYVYVILNILMFAALEPTTATTSCDDPASSKFIFYRFVYCVS